MRRLTLILLSLLYVGVQGLWAEPWSCGDLYTSEEGYIFRIGCDGESSHAEIQGVTTDFVNSLWTNPVFDESGDEKENWYTDDNVPLVTILNIPTILKYNGIEYTVVSLDDGAFEEIFKVNNSDATYRGNDYFDGIKELTIPPAVYCIGSFMFDGWQSLETVTVYCESVQIWDCAFANCPKLSTVYFFGNTVKFYGWVFAEDNALTSFYLFCSELSVQTPTSVDSAEEIFDSTQENGEKGGNAAQNCTVYVSAELYKTYSDSAEEGSIYDFFNKFNKIVYDGMTNEVTGETYDSTEDLAKNGAIVISKIEFLQPVETDDEETNPTYDVVESITVDYDIDGGVQLYARITWSYAHDNNETWTTEMITQSSYPDLLEWSVNATSNYGTVTTESVSLTEMVVTNNHTAETTVTNDRGEHTQETTIAPVTATITVEVTDSDVAGNCVVDFADYVEITLPGSMIVLVGETLDFVAHATYKFSGDQVELTSLDFVLHLDETNTAEGSEVGLFANITKVDAGLEVTGNALGYATLELSLSDYNVKNTCLLVVNDITAIVIDPKSLTLDLNGTYSASVTPEITWYYTEEGENGSSGNSGSHGGPDVDNYVPGNQDLNNYLFWSSPNSNTEVATVNSTPAGVTVTAVSVGETTITVVPITKKDATLGEGDTWQGTCEVTVIQTTLSIAPESTTVVIGSTENALPEVTISPKNSSFENVAWTAPEGLTISEDTKTFTASNTTGEYTLKASLDGNETVYAECTVTVATIESITLNYETIDLVTNTGDDYNNSTTLEISSITWTDPNFHPDNEKSYITWTVTPVPDDLESESVITFNETTGEITAVGNGKATITATSKLNPYKTDTCTINVTTKVKSITLDPTEITIGRPGTATMPSITIEPESATNQTVNWTIADGSTVEMITVEGQSLLNGLSEGSTTLTATVDGVSEVCKVIVKNYLESLNLEANVTTAKVSEDVSLTVEYELAYSGSININDSIVWYCADESVTFSNNTVTSSTVGTKTIYVYDKDYPEVYATIDITFVNYVKAINFSAASYTLNYEEDETLSLFEKITATWADPTDETHSTPEYTVTSITGDENTVSIDKDGKVTPLGGGTVNVTVASTDNPDITATCTIYIKAIVGIGLSKSDIYILKPGETITDLYVTSINWINATNETPVEQSSITWTSSNPDVATFENGTVTAVADGTATITATYTYVDANGGIHNSYSASITIIVATEIINVSGVTVSPTDLTLKVGDIFTELTAEVYPDNATNKNITWSSSDETIATVDPTTGVVTAHKVGTAIITATSSTDNEKSDYCTVTVINYVTGIAFATTEYELNLEDANPSIALSEIEVTWADQDNPENITTEITYYPTDIITIEDGKIVPTADYKTGEVEITATYTDPTTDKTFTATCTVNVVGIEELTIDSTIDYLIVGEAVDLPTVTAYWSTGETVDVTADVQWDIVNGEIVNGQIVASRGGTLVFLSATYYFADGGRGHTAVISIRALAEPVETTAIELSPTYLTLTVGETKNLTAIIWSDGATALTFEWSSDNTSVATVEAQSEFISEISVVTAVGEGTATITVRYGNLSATCLVTVTADSSGGDDGKVDLEGDDDTPHPTPLPDEGIDDDSKNPDDPNNSDNDDDADNQDDDDEATNRDDVIINPDDEDIDTENSQDTEDDEDADYNRNKGDVYEYMRFNLAGQRIEGPQRGINIIKYSDGSKQKVLVK